jgi:signal transduction histidine kinase
VSAASNDPLRVLVVDDDEVDRLAIRRGLTAGGVEATIDERSDGEGLVEAARAGAYDCIVLDHRLPDTSGLDLVRALRAAGVDTPILCVAGSNEEIGAEMVAAGATDFLAKDDLSPARLARRVRHAIRLGRAERQLEQQRDVAVRAAKAREDLLAVVSHDLRGPLSSINVAADAMRDPQLKPDSLGRYLDVIQRSVQRADRLIRDLLDAALIEAGRLTVDPRPVKVKDLLDQVARDHELSAKQFNVAFQVEVDDGLDKVVADRDRLVQALGNLIANSLRHARGATPIELGACVVDGQVELSVRDHGPGIEPELRPRVFDRFWQGRERRGGAGLGLAIVRGIAEAHGGTAVATTPASGPGARIAIRIPRRD